MAAGIIFTTLLISVFIQTQSAFILHRIQGVINPPISIRLARIPNIIPTQSSTTTSETADQDASNTHVSKADIVEYRAERFSEDGQDTGNLTRYKEQHIISAEGEVKSNITDLKEEQFSKQGHSKREEHYGPSQQAHEVLKDGSVEYNLDDFDSRERAVVREIIAKYKSKPTTATETEPEMTNAVEQILPEDVERIAEQRVKGAQEQGEVLPERKQHFTPEVMQVMSDFLVNAVQQQINASNTQGIVPGKVKVAVYEAVPRSLHALGTGSGGVYY